MCGAHRAYGGAGKGDAEVSQVEVRRFQMHPQLLMDVMRRQAGTLGKALLEGVMNSADAKATKCDVTLTDSEASIVDDGQGFPDADTVKKFFEVFGQPHDAKEGKVYGTFRMGRGQLFSFGANVWESQTQRMVVDLQKMGLDYHLEQLSGSKRVAGCAIKVKLYEKLFPSDLAATKTELIHLAKYIGLQLTLNGKLVSVRPEDEEWDYVTDDMYLRLTDRGLLSVYNLGVLVRDYSASQYGMGGVYVSKKQLKVNFARNDVQHDCPIWRKARKIVEEKATGKILKAAVLTDDARENLLRRCVVGSLSVEEMRQLYSTRVITDASGRKHSIAMLHKAQKKILNYTEAKPGNHVADVLIQRELAFVFSSAMLEALGFTTAKQLIAVLSKEWKSLGMIWTWSPLAKLEPLVSDSKYALVPPAEWSVSERIAADLAQQMVDFVHWQEWRDSGRDVREPCDVYRRVIIGESHAAEGWTDGSSYIALSRQELERKGPPSLGYFVWLAQLVLHELCHKEDNRESNVHGMEFYRDYHEMVAAYAPAAVNDMVTRYPQAARRHAKAFGRSRLRTYDKLHSVVRLLRLSADTLEAASEHVHGDETVPGIVEDQAPPVAELAAPTTPRTTKPRPARRRKDAFAVL